MITQTRLLQAKSHGHLWINDTNFNKSSIEPFPVVNFPVLDGDAL